MATIWPLRDASESPLDYHIDWSVRLDGDTIATSTWALTVAAGLSKGSDSHSTTETIIWLSGGTPGQTATLTNTVMTAAGREFVEVISLAIDTDLIIEDGSCPEGADALVTLDFLENYCAARGIVLAGTRVEKKQAIRRGTQFVCNAFTFKGIRTKGRNQWLQWPRGGCYDEEGWTIFNNVIPIEVMHAVCEASAYELANPGGLSPVVTMTDRVRRERIGPIETEYAPIPAIPEAARPVMTILGDILSGLLDDTGGSSLSGTADRV